jgi:hypothetical protein
LILAFGVGALTGATGALTLRRRRHADAIQAADVADLENTALPPLGWRSDEPSPGSMKTSVVQQG